MKKINKYVFLGCILVVCCSAQGMLNSGSAAYRSIREKYRIARPIQGTQPARDLKKRLLTTNQKPQKKEQSVMLFEQPLEVAPLGSTSAIAQEEKNDFLSRIKSWWYGLAQPSQTLVLSEYRVSQMFNFVLSEMKTFRTVLWSEPGQDSVFEQENKWLRSSMATFAKKLNEEYRDVLQGHKSGYSIAGPVLLLIQDYLITAIKNGKLGDRLILAYVFSACDLLQKLRSFGVELGVNDKKIVRNIVQIINERLIDNPNLKTFLQDLNAQVEPNRRLSPDDIAIITKNSALLVPIDEVQSFNEILSAIYNVPLAISSDRLSQLLKSVGMHKHESVLNVFEREKFLKRLYAGLEFQATESTQKEEYKKQAARDEKSIKDILAALSITDEYATVLKRLNPLNYREEKELQELFEGSYSEKRRVLSVEEYILKFLKNKSQQEEMFDRRNFANQRDQQKIMVKE